MKDHSFSTGQTELEDSMDRLYSALSGTPLEAVQCQREQMRKAAPPNELGLWFAGHTPTGQPIWQGEITVTLP